MKIVDSFKLSTVITKSFVRGVGVVLDPVLVASVHLVTSTCVFLISSLLNSKANESRVTSVTVHFAF